MRFGLLTLLACVTVWLAPGVRADDVPSFRQAVMPVLSKAGCNLGTCHGNQNGKGGFKLSLRGENSAADYVSLTHDQNGRRANSVKPDASLFLLKPLMQVPHEGGRRFDRGSPEFDILRRWIAAGMPRTNGRDSMPLVQLKVTPRERVLVEPADGVDLEVIAVFADGTRRDVTQFTCFEPSVPIVEISAAGNVKRLGFGEVTVVARFLDQQVPVRLAFIPQRADFVWKEPVAVSLVRQESVRLIDEPVNEKLRSLRINPSDVCDDVTFLRRVFLDLLGTLPSATESRAFVSDQQTTKRLRLIDELLMRPEFAEFWALKWADLFRVEEKTLDRKGVATFHAWLRDRIATNQPLDSFVRELITARGSTYEQPAANFYRALRDPIMRAETVAQVFLGSRLQCAKCHNHPFDRWTQDDYYGWANQFARVKYEVLENRRRDKNDSHEFDGEQLVLIADEGELKHPGTGDAVRPRMLTSMDSLRLGGDSGRAATATDSADRLLEVAEWLTSRDNRRFAEVQVNRVWFHLIGRGIVDPIDDFRATNPPSNPALLAALTDDFVANGFDVQRLIRIIMGSRTYQRSAASNDTNRDDEANFSRAIIRRLSAEQLADAIGDTINARLEFSGYPARTRAAQLAGVRAIRLREGAPASGDSFLTTFGKPPRLQSCECERSDEATLAQTFQLVSGPILNQLLTQPDNRLRDWLQSTANVEATISDIFQTILNRPPLPTELAAAKKSLMSPRRRQSLEDLVWSLINSDEFLLRH